MFWFQVIRLLPFSSSNMAVPKQDICSCGTSGFNVTLFANYTRGLRKTSSTETLPSMQSHHSITYADSTTSNPHFELHNSVPNSNWRHHFMVHYKDLGVSNNFYFRSLAPGISISTLRVCVRNKDSTKYNPECKAHRQSSNEIRGNYITAPIPEHTAVLSPNNVSNARRRASSWSEPSRRCLRNQTTNKFKFICRDAVLHTRDCESNTESSGKNGDPDSIYHLFKYTDSCCKDMSIMLYMSWWRH